MVTFFVAVLASLFSVINPLGAIPVFLALTPGDTIVQRNKTALNTSIYVILILLAFFWGGSFILSFFGISLDAVRIAGGLVILNSGYSMLSGKLAEGRAINQKVRDEALEKEDISFAPMAMPMLSGPGSISLLIGLYATHPILSERLVISGVVIFTGILIYFILRLAPTLSKLLGVAGMKAISRIMGFIVMSIGVQYIITGVTTLALSVLK